jgi:hypothetical protein
LPGNRHLFNQGLARKEKNSRALSLHIPLYLSNNQHPSSARTKKKKNGITTGMVNLGLAGIEGPDVLSCFFVTAE